ncbi:MAG TPA: T9SS type A sorting domain-containing protein [candidate division Zixibacteria bacterium]|nr:T9SS type A sorting domain-containing protein [candidate division Zixibacteria bacterium]
MTRRLTLFAALIAICLISIAGLAREWTVMVYIGADNNLTTYINGDVDEMESAGSTDDVAILCQIDGLNNYWYNGYNDHLGNGWSTVRRYYIQAGNTSDNRINAGFISDLGHLNSADPNVLRDFATWAIDNYPANRYMLVIWNHGGGWQRPGPNTHPFKAIVWDDSHGDSGIEFANGEFRNMMGQIRDHLGRSINILCFDACIMGVIEAQYETMGYADYLVHSEANIPAEGYNYDFLQWLIADPLMHEETLINHIIDRYGAGYGSSSNITLSGLRLDHSHVDYQMALNDFARELILAGGKSQTDVNWSISNARHFESGMRDLYDFADKVDSRNIGGAGSSVDLAAQAFKASLGYPTRVHEKPLVRNFQRNYSNSYGSMAYMPTSSPSSIWHNLDIAQCNLWGEFISGASSLPSVKLAYWGNELGKYIGTGTPVDLYIRCRNLGSGTASSVTATLSSIDSRVSISGGPVSFGNISGGAVATAASPFTVTISPTVMDSTFMPFEITFSTGKKHKFILTALGEINYPPERVELIAPFDYARMTVGGVLLSWEVPSDPDGDPLHFDVQWDTDPNFSSPTTISSDDNPLGFGPDVPRMIGNCNYRVGSQGEPLLSEGGTYWWRVRAKDEFSNGAWSAARSLTINSSLPQFDWHQTTDAQFFDDFSDGVTIADDRVTIQESHLIFFDDMEYEPDTSAAWTIWNTYASGTNVAVTLENRRQVSGEYCLRVNDRNTSNYAGAWRTFDGINQGVAKVWAKIFNPGIEDKGEFLGLHNGTAYTSSFPIGMVVYAKADTLKFWDGSGHSIHTSMDSLWHYYEVHFDLDAGVSELFIDGVSAGTFGTAGLSQVNMLAIGTKLLGNAAQGTVYADDFELTTAGTADSGVVVGQPVAFNWHPSGATSWGWARWTQNAGDSLKITVQYKSGGGWTNFVSGIAPTDSGAFDIRTLGTADSVRLRATLYFREGHPAPVLFDWSVDWNDAPVAVDENIARPQSLTLGQNFPNPFNAVTSFAYFVPADGDIEITIYNIRGERVFAETGHRKAGAHTLLWDAGDLPSGTYFARLRANGEAVERKLVLIK